MGEAYILEDGAKIAVIGGGPAGSFFSIFAMKMAKIIGKELSLTIFEPKDFTRDGPSGCNRCGGIISELLVQMLAVEGINLPESVVQRGINSYRLHTNCGSAYIETPTHEKTIATVYRGGGPKGNTGKDKKSFDRFLLDLAINEGAFHQPIRIDHIEYKNNKKPVLFSKEQNIMEADLVVGAVGIKNRTTKIFEDMGFGYKKPETITAAIAEIELGRSSMQEIFGSSVHLFLLPSKNIKFAAMIPKGTYVTVCMLGEDMNVHTVDNFLEQPAVKSVLPDDMHIDCRCLPLMNVRAPMIPFADRVVVCGDAGSTRLFKDGLGAAYIMGKTAAKTAVFDGVGEEQFRRVYYPVYKSIMVDNLYGKGLFAMTDLFKKYGILTRKMLKVVRKEQQDTDYPKRLSSILWDMFTGNERYKNIFRRGFSLRMNLDLLR